jgi:hypothetical protein
LPRIDAALVLARQARRDALEGSVEDAIENWRHAVTYAIQDGRTDDAGGWLYAIRAVNARYRPPTLSIDDEHLLAQALPRSTSGRLIRRASPPEADARRAALDSQPTAAIRSGRRWLADSITTGNWVDEQQAAELLGDLYAGHNAPDHATACYQWAGEDKKLVKLAEASGDHRLPTVPPSWGPWWRQDANLAAIAAQEDLLEDDIAGRLLPTLTELVVRGRAGELVDNAREALTLQATKTACALAGRGTALDAQALLDLFVGDVARTESEYRYHDEEHVQACLSIAAHHSELAWPALIRVFDLAEVGTPDALSALTNTFVLKLLRDALCVKIK